MASRATRPRTALAGAAPRSPGAAMWGLARAAAPLGVWFVHLNVSYFLVPPSCGLGSRWPFGVATLVAVAAIALVGAASWRAWQADRRAETVDLIAFLGLAGVAFAALFGATTLLVGASTLVVHPCA